MDKCYNTPEMVEVTVMTEKGFMDSDMILLNSAATEQFKVNNPTAW